MMTVEARSRALLVAYTAIKGLTEKAGLKKSDKLFVPGYWGEPFQEMTIEEIENLILDALDPVTKALFIIGSDPGADGS